LGKRKHSKIPRTPNGSNKDLKEKRKQQTATIAKTLDSLKDMLPKVQEILDRLWATHPVAEKFLLKELGRKGSFCDGIRIPRTPLT
jgi:hypothetical protein